MVYFDLQVQREIKKGTIPKEMASTFRNVFEALDLRKDLNMFDIKKLHTEEEINFFRLRKDKYRAFFFIENEDIYVVSIAKREEVYRKWQ